jgi:uncharacterized protein YjbJ (UPF0337 family)
MPLICKDFSIRHENCLSILCRLAAAPVKETATAEFETIKRSYVMNWDQITGNWKQFTGKIKEKWGKLTDDDLKVVAGKRDQLAGLLQERYGYHKAQAEKELDDFTKSLKP